MARDAVKSGEAPAGHPRSLTLRAGCRQEKSNAQLTPGIEYENLFLLTYPLGAMRVFVRRVHNYNPDILPLITSLCA